MGKNSNKTNVKVVKNSKKESDREAAIKELEEKLDKMKEDRDNKCKAAKAQLVDMLNITADKYRTATGTAEALRVVRFVFDGKTVNDVAVAAQLALKMSAVAASMATTAESLEYSEMDKLCDGFYSKDFATDASECSGCLEDLLAEQMMRIDLCRNVGGSAEDMVSFVKRVEEEIVSTEKALADLKAEENNDR